VSRPGQQAGHCAPDLGLSLRWMQRALAPGGSDMARNGLFAASLAAFCLSVTARAGVNGLLRQWENASRDASGISHVQISRPAAPCQRAHLWRLPSDRMQLGHGEGQELPPPDRVGRGDEPFASFNSGFARKQISSAKGGRSASVRVLTVFRRRLRPHDFDMTGRLKHTTWAGPIGQSWENSRWGTGWARRAQRGVAKAGRDLRTFDPGTVQAVQGRDFLEIMAANKGWSRPAPTRTMQGGVLATIRHYGFDRMAASARRHGLLETRRGDGGHTDGRPDCIAFNPTTAHASQIGHRWKIVDGVKWIAISATRTSGFPCWR